MILILDLVSVFLQYFNRIVPSVPTLACFVHASSNSSAKEQVLKPPTRETAPPNAAD